MKKRCIDIPLGIGNGNRFVSGSVPRSLTHKIHFRTDAVYDETICFTVIRITFGKITRAYTEARHHTFHYERNIRSFHTPCVYLPYFSATIEQVC